MSARRQPTSVSGFTIIGASAYAVPLGSIPVAIDQRARLLAFSARLAARLAEIGGSRCCKKAATFPSKPRGKNSPHLATSFPRRPSLAAASSSPPTTSVTATRARTSRVRVRRIRQAETAASEVSVRSSQDQVFRDRKSRNTLRHPRPHPLPKRHIGVPIRETQPHGFVDGDADEGLAGEGALAGLPGLEFLLSVGKRVGR